MFRDPPFRFFSPSLKLLALIMVMIVVFLLVLALGVALSIPFFGPGLLDDLANYADYGDQRTIFALKYFQIVNQLGVFVIPAIVFIILTENNITAYVGMDRRPARFVSIFGLLALIASLPFISWVLDLNAAMHLPGFLAGVEEWMRKSEDSARQLTDAFLLSDTWGGFLVNLFMIAGLAALGEELIFRGILIRLFREWTYSDHWAVVISALLFSAMHLQFYGFFGRFILGLFLGYLFVWSGSLWVPIIVHFFNNAMAVILAFLSRKGIANFNLETFGSTDNPWIIAASFVVMMILMGMIFYHQQIRPQKKTPETDRPGV